MKEKVKEARKGGGSSDVDAGLTPTKERGRKAFRERFDQARGEPLSQSCLLAESDSGITALLSHCLGTAKAEAWPCCGLSESEGWLLRLLVNRIPIAGHLSRAFSWLLTVYAFADSSGT